MSSHVIDRGSRLGRGAAVGVDTEQVAHLLMPMAVDIERFGVSVCGYPAEYLEIVAELRWAAVVFDRRCPHCNVADPATTG